MENSIKLYSLQFADIKSYLYAAIFVAGNILLPQLCHLIPIGGQILLPIYFFTLIAAYKYGFFTGILTAVASPLINHALFGMPGVEMLSIILIKSALLATGAAYIAQKTNALKIQSIAVVILFYQGLGMLAEWGISGSLFVALQDVRIGMPGIIIQLVGGYLLLKAMKK